MAICPRLSHGLLQSSSFSVCFPFCSKDGTFRFLKRAQTKASELLAGSLKSWSILPATESGCFIRPVNFLKRISSKRAVKEEKGKTAQKRSHVERRVVPTALGNFLISRPTPRLSSYYTTAEKDQHKTVRSILQKRTQY
jgi:hypothetical protein